jgi:hypothetical protein
VIRFLRSNAILYPVSRDRFACHRRFGEAHVPVTG